MVFLLGSYVMVNGHKLTELPTRDALLPVLIVLFNARYSSVLSLMTELPQRYTHSDRLTEFAVEKSQQIIKYGKQYTNQLVEQLGFADVGFLNLNTTDGLRFTLNNGDVVHLRPSGNAPEFRCYAESQTLEQAKNLVNRVLPLLAKIKF